MDAQIETIPATVKEDVAAAAPKTDKLYIKGVAVTLGGFVALEGIDRSRNQAGDVAPARTPRITREANIGQEADSSATGNTAALRAELRGCGGDLRAVGAHPLGDDPVVAEEEREGRPQRRLHGEPSSSSCHPDRQLLQPSEASGGLRQQVLVGSRGAPRFVVEGGSSRVGCLGWRGRGGRVPRDGGPPFGVHHLVDAEARTPAELLEHGPVAKGDGVAEAQIRDRLDARRQR